MNSIKSKATYSGYFTSLQSENTVRKIPQPVKIAQLFGSSGHLQSGQKTSSNKISLPERVTPYLKKPSSQKKNVTNTCIKWPRNERNARRNLKFTETLNSVTKIKKCAKAGRNDENTYPKKENLGLSTRRSFLLPPNTIKELHIKNRKQNKLEVSQFRILTVSSENTNPRLSETSKSSSPPMANISAHVDSVVNVKKNKTSLIQSISSQTFNVNEQSGINILHSSYSDLADTDDSPVEKIPENLNSNEISNVNICESQNNDCDIIINRSHVSLSSASATNVRRATDLPNDDDVDRNDICCAERHSRSYTTFILPNAEKVKVDRERSSSTTSSTNIYEDFYSSLQTVKMISETCLNLQRSTNEDERATLSKTELTVLGSKLNHLVCRLEEDMSDLKLTLTTVTNVLSATNMENKEIKDTNETKITQQIIEITENLNDNVKAMDNIDTTCITRIDTERDNTLKETHKMLDINRSNFLETNGKDNLYEMQLSDQMYFASGSDKENKEILNSPIVKHDKKLDTLNAANDSFVTLENELDIVNRKSNIPRTPFTNQTPAKNKYQNQTTQERPMKEYMALKSRMSCLLTPNIKRFNPSEPRNNIHCETDNAKISVSDKLLAELYKLYEDSL